MIFLPGLRSQVSYNVSIRTNLNVNLNLHYKEESLLRYKFYYCIGHRLQIIFTWKYDPLSPKNRICQSKR